MNDLAGLQESRGPGTAAPCTNPQGASCSGMKVQCPPMPRSNALTHAHCCWCPSIARTRVQLLRARLEEACAARDAAAQRTQQVGTSYGMRCRCIALL